MYARHITGQLKNNVVSEFPKIMEKEILPLLRKQTGFLDEVLLVAPNNKEAIAISLWEEKSYAEAYDRYVYPEIVKILSKYIDGIPVVKTFEVNYATLPAFQKLLAVSNN
jgi:hypothetical protein